MAKIMNRFKENLTNWINRNPIAISITTFLILLILIVIFDIRLLVDDFSNSLNNILFEAHGLLFDLLVFGIILGFINIALEKKQRIERYKEEIDDYRRWDEKEATFRISGNIRRLNKLGVTNIDLSFCYLRGAQLENVNLENSNLFLAQLQNANLKKAVLNGAYLQAAFLQEADMSEAQLRNTNLTFAKLQNSMIFNADFQGATLQRSQMCGAVLSRSYSNTPFFIKDEEGNLVETDTVKHETVRANLKGANLQAAVAYAEQKEEFIQAGVNIDEMIFKAKNEDEASQHER